MDGCRPRRWRERRGLPEPLINLEACDFAAVRNDLEKEHCATRFLNPLIVMLRALPFQKFLEQYFVLAGRLLHLALPTR
jgi:hypothetical protein